jgi:hypothetical protein
VNAASRPVRHAADGYVADHWTVTIDCDEMPSLYRQLVELLLRLLEIHTVGIVTSEILPNYGDCTAVANG